MVALDERNVTEDGITADLDWIPPPGRRTVLRVGYSMTGNGVRAVGAGTMYTDATVGVDWAGRRVQGLNAVTMAPAFGYCLSQGVV
jgi:hypothetical protein